MRLCGKGLHDLDAPGVAKITSAGKRCCRPCWLKRDREYKRRLAAEPTCRFGHPWEGNARWITRNGTRYRRCTACEVARADATNKHISDALTSRHHPDIVMRLMELAIARENAMPWEKAAYAAEIARLQSRRPQGATA